MQLTFGRIAVGMLCLGYAMAAATTASGSVQTVTACNSSYGSKTVPPPLPTYSTFNRTTNTLPATVSTVVTSTKPRSTVTTTTTFTNTLIVEATTTVTKTSTTTKFAGSTSTVTVSTPVNFTPLAAKATATVRPTTKTTSVSLTKESTQFQTSPTQPPKIIDPVGPAQKRSSAYLVQRQNPTPSGKNTIVTAVFCTTKINFVPATRVTRTSTTTITPPATTTTVENEVIITSFGATAVTTRTVTATARPTARYYPGCQADNLATSLRTGNGQIQPINFWVANDDIFWIKGIEGNTTTAAQCCEKCADDPRVYWVGLGDGTRRRSTRRGPYNYKCTHKTLQSCPFQYPLTYGHDPEKSIPKGSIVLSNGYCGEGWVRYRQAYPDCPYTGLYTAE